MWRLKEVHGGRSRVQGQTVLSGSKPIHPTSPAFCQESTRCVGDKNMCRFVRRGPGQRSFFHVSRNDLLFNVTVDLVLPSAVFPCSEVKATKPAVVTSLLNSPSDAITLPSWYFQLTPLDSPASQSHLSPSYVFREDSFLDQYLILCSSAVLYQHLLLSSQAFTNIQELLKKYSKYL